MERPNIIILNPDEMRCDAMGHMGNDAAHTPNLDRFAAEEAVSFANAYCQNTVCVPSRCSFLTGLYPHVHGHRTMGHLLRAHETSLFRELKTAGYHVWMNARNDLVAGQIPGLYESHASEIYYNDIQSAGKREGTPGYPYSHFEGITENGEPAAVERDMADTQAAVSRIAGWKKEQPLCLFLGWENPHPPYAVSRQDYGQIRKEKLLPRIRMEETHGKSRMLRRLEEYAGLRDFPEEMWERLRAVYLAQCGRVDAMFAMVCDALKENGMYENSAIFFLSDHGDFAGDYGLPEKAQNTFENCLTRVPFLVKPPAGCAADAGVSESLVELVDFYATAMDYAGVAPDHDQFGRSLRRVIGDRRKEHRSVVCCEGGRLAGEIQCDEYHAFGAAAPGNTSSYWPKLQAQLDSAAHEKGTMIFDGRYKYVERLSGRNELYDLAEDPGERKNLYPEMEDSPVVRRLERELLHWYQETCDTVPRDYDSRWGERKLERMFPDYRERIRQGDRRIAGKPE